MGFDYLFCVENEVVAYIGNSINTLGIIINYTILLEVLCDLNEAKVDANQKEQAATGINRSIWNLSSVGDTDFEGWPCVVK